MDLLSSRVLLGAASGARAAAEDLLVGGFSSPYIHSYSIGPTGFGAKYANPSTLLSLGVLDIAATPTKDAIILSLGGSPYYAAYRYSPGTGFGTKYANVSVLPLDASQSASVTVHPNNNAVVFGNQPNTGVNAQIHAYQWSSSTGFGTKYSNPSSFRTENVLGVDFSPSGDDIALGYAGGISSANVEAYEWNSSTGFGTRRTTSTLVGSVYNVRFHPSGNAVIGSSTGQIFTGGSVQNVTPGFAFAYSSGSGYGSQYTSPTSFPQLFSRTISVSNSGSDVVFGLDNSPNLIAYPFSASTGFGAKYANPSTGLPGSTSVVDSAFNSDDSLVAITVNTSPRIQIYPFTSGTGFGSKFADPSVIPAGFITSVAFISTP